MHCKQMPFKIGSGSINVRMNFKIVENLESLINRNVTGMPALVVAKPFNKVFPCHAVVFSSKKTPDSFWSYNSHGARNPKLSVGSGTSGSRLEYQYHAKLCFEITEAFNEKNDSVPVPKLVDGCHQEYQNGNSDFFVYKWMQRPTSCKRTMDFLSAGHVSMPAAGDQNKKDNAEDSSNKKRKEK